MEALGERIRLLRERRGMTQQELAERAGFSAHQIVSQIERGQRELKASELFRIARVLHVDLESLGGAVPSGVPVVLWRKRPEGDWGGSEPELVERCRRYRNVLTVIGDRPGHDLPKVEVDVAHLDCGVAEKAAQDFARRIGPCSDLASSLAEILEAQFGVQVWFVDMGEQGGSAACSIGDFGAAVFVNSLDPPWRRNFDLAHEVFHLLTWDSLGPEVVSTDDTVWRRCERLADTFAANLLLPADAVSIEVDHRRGDKGEIAWMDLIDIARRFGVSTEALLWRLKSLRRISEAQVLELKEDESFKRLDRAARRGSWWRPAPLPERFVRTAFMAHSKGYLSRLRLAEYLETNLAGLSDVLAEYGLWGTDDYQKALATT